MVQSVSNLPRAISLLVAIALFSGVPFQSEFAPVVRGQSRTHTATSRSEPKSDPDLSELNARIAEANTARASGDPIAINAASRHLIAAALRQMAELRMVEAAFPQAAELYSKALDFDASAETRADLGLAELQQGKLDEAISDADMARATSPLNVTADQVLSRALMQKGDYARAAESLTRLANAQPDIPTLYSLSLCLLATKKPEDKQRAVQVFGQMQNIAGDSGSLHVLFGRAYRDAEDMPSAINEFRRAIQIDPTTPHAHYFLGLAQLSQNEWKPIP